MVTADIGSPSRSEAAYRFDFCGGHLAIDFTNTIGSRGSDSAHRVEHLVTFGDVLAWAEAARLVNRAGAAKLRAHAAAKPEAARAEVGRALELRETLYRVFAARARGRMPNSGDVAALNRFVGDVFAGARLSPSGDGFVLETASGDGLDAVLRPVVRAAIDLLTSSSAQRIGMCADDSCAWLFLDATRSGTRRWCDMKGCGNRNKVRRFRATL